MANREKGEVTLRLDDGREFVLCMDFEMRCAVEDMLDKPFMQVAEEAQKGFHRSIRAIFWGALQRYHPGMSLGDVTALLSEHETEIAAAMNKASDAASPEAEGGDSPRPPKSGSGGKPRPRASSGASGAKRA